MSDFYLIGLARGRSGFYCPVSRFHLVGGAMPRKEWPAQAPLTQAVKVGLRSGTLVDMYKNIPFEAYATKSQLAAALMADIKQKQDGREDETPTPPTAPTAPDALKEVGEPSETPPQENEPSGEKTNDGGKVLTEEEIDGMSKKDLLNFIKEQGIEKEELDVNNRSDEDEIKHALKVHFGHKMV